MRVKKNNEALQEKGGVPLRFAWLVLRYLPSPGSVNEDFIYLPSLLGHGELSFGIFTMGAYLF